MPRPMDVYEELVHLRRNGQKAALATIVEVQGSTPSAQSAKLLVREVENVLRCLVAVPIICVPNLTSPS